MHATARFMLIVLTLFLVFMPHCLGFEILIDVAPATLNLGSQGAVVTVHTDLSYAAVDVTSVYINGILIRSWKADNQGNFVAKFSMDEVKKLDGLIIGDYNVLKMVGLIKSGDAFWGEQEILVLDNVPKGKGGD